MDKEVVDMFKIYKKVGADLYDFTDICGKLTLRSTDSEISEQLSFDVKGKFIKEDDIIQLYEDKTKVFEGITISVDIDENITSVNVFDFGWYLNKNEDIYQFNNSVSKCITQICNNHDVPIGGIVNIPISFKKIIRGNLNDIIKKLMEYATKNNGIKYIWEMREGKFHLEKESSNVIIYNTKLFGGNIDITKLMNGASVKRSIENLVNAVKVADQEDSKVTVLAYKEDSSSIAKHGKIQKLESISKDERKTAKSIAANQLKLLNKVEITTGVTLPGVMACRANKVLQFDDTLVGISGKFKIKQCTHNISSTSHLMDLDLEVL